MSNIYQRLIGLTGGIGTGKTTVSRYLASVYKLPVLDADIYAREAVKVGSPILDDIFMKYGKRVQSDNGTLNRKQLGEIIFNDFAEKKWLESKIHPYVRKCFELEIKRLGNNTIVLVIPLLFEVKMTDLVTETWVVTCSHQEQLKRLVERDQLSLKEVIARIKSQFPLAEKIAAADVVLENSSTLENLYQQIDAALKYSCYQTDCDR